MFTPSNLHSVSKYQDGAFLCLVTLTPKNGDAAIVDAPYVARVGDSAPVNTWILEQIATMQGIPDFAEPVKTLEQMAKELEVGIQAHLNATAKAAGYDNIFTACTYADEPAVAKFQTEGAALRAWRSNVWAYCYTVLTAVQAKTRTVPTLAELIAELPTAPK